MKHILTLTAVGFCLLNCWLEKSRCQIYSCSHCNVTAKHYHQALSDTNHDTALTTESHHTERGLLKYPSLQQNRESGSVTFTSVLPGCRDTTECCQGARDFLIQTFLNCCWPITGQHSGHVISLNQSNASILIAWSVWTNHKPVYSEDWPMGRKGVLSLALAHSTHVWFIAPSYYI